MLNIVGKDDDIFPRVVIDEVDEKENGDEVDANDGNKSPMLLEEQHNKGGCRRDDNVVDFCLFRRLSIFDDDRKENDDQSMTEGRNVGCQLTLSMMMSSARWKGLSFTLPFRRMQEEDRRWELKEKTLLF